MTKRVISFIFSAAIVICAAFAASATAYAAEENGGVAAYAGEDAELSANTEENAELAAGSEQTEYEELGASAPNYPEITRFDNLADGTKISWSAYRGAAQYGIYQKNGSKWVKLATTTALSYTHRNVSNETKTVYTVRAFDKFGNYASSYNADGYTNVFLAPPSISSLSNTNEGVKIKWNRTGSAESYRVFRKNKNGSWDRLGETTGDSFTDGNVSPGVAYNYTIRCIRSDLKQYMSGYNNGKTVTYVAAPKITEIANNSASGSKITWNKSAGAAKYRVFVKDGASWKRVGDSASTSLTHVGLTSGKKYVYTVRCLDSGNNYCSDYNAEGWENVFLTAPTLQAADNTADGIQIQWSALAGAEKYRVYKRVQKTDPWAKAGETSGTSLIDKSVAAGVTYQYTVRCISADSKRFTSDYNSFKSVTCSKAPVFKKIENAADGVKFTWEPSQGVAKYRVYLWTGSSWKEIGETSGTSFVYTGVKNGESNIYTLRCLDSGGNYLTTYNKSGWRQLYLAPPAISKISKSGSANLIEWQKSPYAPAYRLYRRTPASSWKIVYEGTSTSYKDAAVETGRAYTYTLRYLNEEGSLITSYIDNTRYYVNGSLANGAVSDGGTKYNFTNGLINVNSIAGSSKDGYYYIDGSGNRVTGKEIQYAVDFVIKYGKGSSNAEKLRSCFNALYKNYPYARVYGVPTKGTDIQSLAIQMFEKKSGNCFCYAASFACIARVLGYDSRVVTGQIASAYGGLTAHGWTEVYIDGGWYIFDPDMQMDLSAYSFYKQTYSSYPVKPLVADKRFTLKLSNGKAVWS